jgi:hypothetical protein
MRRRNCGKSEALTIFHIYFIVLYFVIDLLNQILCVLDFRWILSPSLRITEEGRGKEGQNLLLDLSPN